MKAIKVYSLARKYFSIIIALSFPFIFPFAGMGQSEDSEPENELDTALEEQSPPISETNFYELHLSSDGVYGIDESGNEWEYDFSLERFVDEESSSRTTMIIYGQERELEALEQLEQELEDLELQGDALEELAGKLKSVKRFKGLQYGSVEIEEGEIATGTIIAIGKVTVKGIVRGDVISYKGITITSTGTIEGDARAPEILKMRGGVITGERRETDLPTIPEIDIFEKTSYTALTAILIIFGSLVSFGLLAMAIIKKPIVRVRQCLETDLVKSFFIGLAMWIALGPLMALLVLTIIGIPVAVFILPLALVVAIIISIIGSSQYLGVRLKTSFEWCQDSLFRQTLVGLSILMLPWIFMSLFMISTSEVSDWFSVFFRIIAIIIWSIVICAGIGAVILTRFGSRDCVRKGDKSIKVTAEFGKVKPPSPPPLKPDIPRPGRPPEAAIPKPPPLKDNDKNDID